MIDLTKPLDQLDYKVVPINAIQESNAWQVVVLRGDHKDKNFVFTDIEYNGKTNNLRFSLDVVKNGNFEQTTPELEDLAFNILEDVIKRGIVDGSVLFDDKDSSN